MCLQSCKNYFTPRNPHTLFSHTSPHPLHPPSSTLVPPSSTSSPSSTLQCRSSVRSAKRIATGDVPSSSIRSAKQIGRGAASLRAKPLCTTPPTATLAPIGATPRIAPARVSSECLPYAATPVATRRASKTHCKICSDLYDFDKPLTLGNQ